MRKNTSADDPRGLIADAYRIPDISPPECRSIFLDWALEPREASELRAASARLLAEFVGQHPDHPMNGILHEAGIAINLPAIRRGGRRARS